MNFKALVSIGLSLAIVLLGANTSVYASEKPVSEVIKDTSDIYTKEGELLGTVSKTHNVTVNEKAEGTRTTVITFSDYTLLPEYADDINYTSVFKDETITTDIYFDNTNKKIIVDGEDLDVNALVSASDNIQKIQPLNDTGGIPAICHYYSNSALSSYSFGCYESMNYNWIGNGNGQGEPEGRNIQKVGIKSSSQFAVAKNGVDLFDNGYASFRQAYAVTLAAAATAGWSGIIWAWSPVGWIVGASPVAASAGVTISNFNSAKSQLGKAFMYINVL